MMKKLILIAPLFLLTACGPKIKLVPTAYMPAPPEILMKDPKELKPIKQEAKPEKKPPQ
jgi:hypothetical protein